jgi:hypothetical protein
MGLDFSHGGAHWSYSGFHDFRVKLAAEIGIDLNNMWGFGGQTPWGDPKEEHIIYLLDHSDCEGDLSPAKCRKVAKRLRELVASWDNGDSDKLRALELAEGMAFAHQKHQRLRFC